MLPKNWRVSKSVSLFLSIIKKKKTQSFHSICLNVKMSGFFFQTVLIHWIYKTGHRFWEDEWEWGTLWAIQYCLQSGTQRFIFFSLNPTIHLFNMYIAQNSKAGIECSPLNPTEF